MKPQFPLRYFLASVLLLAGLATLFSLSAALRTQQELRRQVSAFLDQSDRSPSDLSLVR